MFARQWALIFKNTLRNRRRSLLTASSLAVSLCLLAFLLAMYQVLFLAGDATPAQALRLVTRQKVSLTIPLPTSYERKIEQLPGVAAVSVSQWFGGTYRDARDSKNFFARMAVEPAKFFAVRPELVIPEDQKHTFETDRTACVASRELAHQFGWKIGERIPIEGDIFPVNLDLKLVGIFDDPEHAQALFFNWEYLRQSLPAPKQDSAGLFILRAERASDVSQIARTIDDMFANSPTPTITESERAFQLSFISFLGNLKLFLLAVCGAVTFTILLVTGNTMSMSVRERIREVGILKTLGFQTQEILSLLISEAALTAFFGGVAGCGLATLLCAFVRNVAGGSFTSLQRLNVTPSVTMISLIMALLIGILSASWPAIGAARTPILDSLRHTG